LRTKGKTKQRIGTRNKEEAEARKTAQGWCPPRSGGKKKLIRLLWESWAGKRPARTAFAFPTGSVLGVPPRPGKEEHPPLSFPAKGRNLTPKKPTCHRSEEGGKGESCKDAFFSSFSSREGEGSWFEEKRARLEPKRELITSPSFYRLKKKGKRAPLTRLEGRIQEKKETCTVSGAQGGTRRLRFVSRQSREKGKRAVLVFVARKGAGQVLTPGKGEEGREPRLSPIPTSETGAARKEGRFYFY